MDVEITTQEPSHDLFAAEDVYQYEYASSGQRFLNWLVDNLFMRFAMSWLTGYAVGYFLAKFFPDFYLDMVYSKGFEWYLTLYLVAFLNYLIYYTFCEKVCNGYTIGKLITGTRAIKEDGSELTLKEAVLRSLSRMVPFEALSLWVGNGLWHDAWTKTIVIKTR
jgi:uncharacterized RDD family membrane protein YckC